MELSGELLHEGTKCSEMHDDIFSKVEQKKQTNKDERLLSFLFTFDPDTYKRIL